MGRKLGQHFLFDPAIVNRIADAGGLGPSDTVLEVGPGPGALTRALAERAGRVVAVELDSELLKRLRADMAGYSNVQLHLGDALRFDCSSLGPFSVVANIPYQITTPLIFHLLKFRPALRSMTLTVQKEVAERIASPPGSKSYGVLSVAVQYVARTEVLFTIPASAFRPPPKVDSACVRMEVYREPPIKVDDEDLFMRVVRAAFQQRRKTLRNSLGVFSPEIKNLLLEAGVDPGARAETLGMEDFARVASLVAKQSPRQ